jgi:hypothetical protein
MKRPAVFLIACLSGWALLAQEIFSPALLRDPLWDDGNAEYSVYRAEEVREGLPRKTETVHIVVKEPFNGKLRVKSDSPARDEVLKMNQVVNVPTGVYAFHQMHSSFWDRATGELLKFSLTSNDSCGNSFKMGWSGNGFLELTYHTYWDGEGDGVLKKPLPKDALFYDELPWRLRCLRDSKTPREVRVMLFPSVIGSKLGKPEFAPATLRVAPDGARGEYRVEVRHSAGTDVLSFDSRPPWILKNWKRSDGSSLNLKKTQRIQYWKKSRPGDENLLE